MRRNAPTGLRDGHAAQGLAYCRAAASDAKPRYMVSDVAAPFRTVGVHDRSSLKASFWNATVEEARQLGDPDFVSIALNVSGGRIWRNDEARPTEAGAVALQPFDGARWRFELPVSFVHLYVPFELVCGVSESLFEEPLTPCELGTPAAVRDEGLCRAASKIQSSLSAIEPTNLILDSWALVLSELVVRRFSRHSGKPARVAFGKIPVRSIAHVVDYIEAEIEQDLRLAALARVAAMSPFHFARRFKETVGVSPHAYVLGRRVERARGMLRRSESSLAQVAAACGFSSQSHLTTAFQSVLGVTPYRYRRAFTQRLDR